MAGSVTGLHVFAADVGPEPLSLLDGNFSPLATAVNTLSTFSNYYVDSGAVNALAITVNAPQVVASYTDGLQVQVQVANTTTSATPTLAINGLGARTLIHSDGSTLAIGELVAGMRFTAIYDSTLAEFRILSPTFTAVTLNAPTFNATVTINAVATKQSLVVNGAANQFASVVLASSTSGQSYGLQVSAGTTSADQCIQFRSQNAANNFLLIYGDGHGSLGPSVSLGLSWTSGGALSIAAPTGSATALTISAAANGYGLIIGASTTSGQSFGLLVNGGTTSADFAFRVLNAASAINYVYIRGDGSGALGYNGTTQTILFSAVGAVTISAATSGTNTLTLNGPGGSAGTSMIFSGGPLESSAALAVGFVLNSSGVNFGLIQNDAANTFSLAYGSSQNALGTPAFQWTSTPQILGRGPVAAALVDMTPDKGTFTLTLTGMTAATTVTAQWSRNGNQVILNIPVVTGTSNATTFTCTGLPAAIQPTNQQCVSRSQLALGAGSIGAAEGQISGGTITWITLGSSTGFSASGTKGFQFGATLSWELN